MMLLILALYGLLIGSFLNAWIWRISAGKSVAKGRSECPHCHTTLKWYELIPVISFIALRAKCRTCHKPISWQYPLVELATAVLWCALWLAIQPHTLYDGLHLAIWLVAGSLLVAAFVYDARWMLLPEVFTLPAIVIAGAWLVVRWLGYGEGQAVLAQLLAASVFGGAFWALSYFSGGKLLGDGDNRLAFLMGLLLTPAQLVLAIGLSFNLGALVGVGLIVSGRKTRRDPIAFGPFLITALWLAFFCGDWLIALYFRLLSA